MNALKSMYLVVSSAISEDSVVSAIQNSRLSLREIVEAHDGAIRAGAGGQSGG
jgi:hypothetical protein